MYKLTAILFLLATTIGYAQLPEDALDENVVLIFNPDASVDNNEDTLNHFTEKIIENGFNLVGKYMFSDSQASLQEIEFDMQNKDVKYVFLLTYRYYKGPDYDLYFFENDKDLNPDILDPDKEILQLKPGFVTTKKDPRVTIFKKLKKEVAELKEEFTNVNTASYDTALLNTLLLSEENIKTLQDLNAKNTLIDGVTLSIENTGVPADLKSSKLAVIATSEEEYRSYKALNSVLKSRFKKYPYEYVYFKNYDSYLAKGGDASFAYRLQLTKSSASMLGSSKTNFTASELYKRDMGNNTLTGSLNSTPINYEKDLFTVVIKNNTTQERFLVSKRGFVSSTLKGFISEL